MARVILEEEEDSVRVEDGPSFGGGIKVHCSFTMAVWGLLEPARVLTFHVLFMPLPLFECSNHRDSRYGQRSGEQ